MPRTRAPARRRHPPDVRRGLILEAARSLIVAEGLAGTSVRELAAACGVSTGTITYHFAGVDEILGEVLRSESERFYQPLETEALGRDSALEGLRVLADGLLADGPETLEYWRLWLDYWARAAHDPALAAWHSERYRVWRGVVESLVARGVERGEFRPVDARAIAVELVALLDGLVIQAVFDGSEVSLSEARERLRTVIELHLLPPD